MINEDSLITLRKKIQRNISEKRFLHILGVERCAASLGAYCLPGKTLELRAAALLHDVAKEIPLDKQIEIIQKNGKKLSADDLDAPQVIHSICAPHIVLSDFADFATSDILSSVEKHTLGDSKMSVFDEIIFISDYVEDGRTHESCVQVRNFIFDNFIDSQFEHNVKILHSACIMAIDYTIDMLKARNQNVHPRMLEAKNAISSLD